MRGLAVFAVLVVLVGCDSPVEQVQSAAAGVCAGVGGNFSGGAGDKFGSG